MYSTEFLLNTATIREVAIDFFCLKSCGERNTELRAITTSYKQPHKLSKLRNTQLNLLTVTCDLKVNRGKLTLIQSPMEV